MGIRQIFVRFAGCNMQCEFCDVETPFPAKQFSVDKLTSILKQISENTGDHHSISFTGGEPLLQNEFLKNLIPRLKEMPLKIYLETNATLPASLKDIIDFVDIVALDFKLPSATGGRAYWNEHREFLGIARKKDCFVKSVITNETKDKDIQKAIDIIREVDENILFILQPVWPIKGVEQVKRGLLFDYLFLAEKRLKNTRVMPQMHKFLGLK